MENKKDLVKIALTALILASALPVNGQAETEENGILLAAGCPAHGCAAQNGGGQSPVSQDGRVNNNQPLDENQLLGALNAQGRAIYLGLDSEGKALAIQLASQDSYRDKNLAVKEAQRRMNERRGFINR